MGNIGRPQRRIEVLPDSDAPEPTRPEPAEPDGGRGRPSIVLPAPTIPRGPRR